MSNNDVKYNPDPENDSETIANMEARQYNVYNAMRCPRLIQNPSNISVENILTDVVQNGTNYMVGYPFSGTNADYGFGQVQSNGFYNGVDLAVGSNYFLPLGLCNKESTPECVGRRRWVYMRNIPTGKIPLFFNASFHGLTGCNMEGLTEGRGILSGLLEDISDIAPNAVMEAVGSQGNYGSFKCQKATYPVGYAIYDPEMENVSWVKDTKCTPSYHYLKTSTSSSPQLYPSAPYIGQTETFGSPILSQSHPQPQPQPHQLKKQLKQLLKWYGLIPTLLVLIYTIHKLVSKK